jgi:antitoxin component HigA of HigAB toxin-antitoxin module
MLEAVKTRHIKRQKSITGHHYVFKKNTPENILTEISLRYADYIEQADDEQLLDISTTEWFKNMEKRMTPKDYLRNLREAYGLTQKQLGEEIKSNAAHISDYETGQRSISKDVAKKLAKIFNVSPAVFI